MQLSPTGELPDSQQDKGIDCNNSRMEILKCAWMITNDKTRSRKLEVKGQELMHTNNLDSFGVVYNK